jgi:hypothetical protein
MEFVIMLMFMVVIVTVTGSVMTASRKGIIHGIRRKHLFGVVACAGYVVMEPIFTEPLAYCELEYLCF